MMNGPMRVFGSESALKSGTSLPTHFCFASLHQTCLRSGSQGLPLRSHDARLYKTRRFIGHDHAQLGWMPRPDGSSGLRRCVRAPASVHEPQKSQLPDIVEPSSRKNAKPGSCWSALIVVLVFWSVTSPRALPFSSLATSARDGLYGFV